MFELTTCNNNEEYYTSRKEIVKGTKLFVRKAQCSWKA